MLTPVWEVEPRADRPRIVHVNATATGGGVAELLRGLVSGQRKSGINAGWAVIAGTDEFYKVTKFLHHLLHGEADPAGLDDPEPLRSYRAVLEAQAQWFAGQFDSGDVVVLHDPQTLGLAPMLRGTGARLVWHCHVGADVEPHRGPAAVWRSLATELDAVDAVVTTIAEFAPPAVPEPKRFVVQPAVDPAALKNRDLTSAEVAGILDRIGLTSERRSPDAVIERRAPLPDDARVVVQVSRWDPLKDMPGVLRCVSGLPADVHVVLAGTDPEQIPDDPEGVAVYSEVLDVLERMPESDRDRVHLVRLSMVAPGQNALAVNALQRRADVVLQKSLQEGFGLTVTEAMIKGRAVVASAVGGIRQQVTHGYNGLLIDPDDHDSVVAALIQLLDDPSLRDQLGERAHNSVMERYTMRRLIEDYRVIAEPAQVTG